MYFYDKNCTFQKQLITARKLLGTLSQLNKKKSASDVCY